MLNDQAFLGLGSNIGDSIEWLRFGLERLPKPQLVSPVYSTEPVGGPEQDNFMNLVVQIEWVDSPESLLELCQSIEQQAGRTREVENGPRTLDIDILLMGDRLIGSPDLMVPHPAMFERNFVMKPLLDIWPSFVETDLFAANYEPEPIGDVTKLGLIEAL